MYGRPGNHFWLQGSDGDQWEGELNGIGDMLLVAEDCHDVNFVAIDRYNNATTPFTTNLASWQLSCFSVWEHMKNVRANESSACVILRNGQMVGYLMVNKFFCESIAKFW